MSFPKSLEYEYLLQEQIEDMNKRLCVKLSRIINTCEELPRGRLKINFKNKSFMILELTYNGFYLESSFVDERFEELTTKILTSEDRLLYMLNTFAEEAYLAI